MKTVRFLTNPKIKSKYSKLFPDLGQSYFFFAIPNMEVQQMHIILNQKQAIIESNKFKVKARLAKDLLRQ